MAATLKAKQGYPSKEQAIETVLEQFKEMNREKLFIQVRGLGPIHIPDLAMNVLLAADHLLHL
eukprot:c15858_g1_i1 orf=240-428(+)